MKIKIVTVSHKIGEGPWRPSGSSRHLANYFLTSVEKQQLEIK